MTAATGGVTPPRRRGPLRRSPLVHLILAVLLLAVTQTLLIKPFQVPSRSMAPTLEVGDRILASRVAVAVSAPGPGDIVVFSRPDDWGPPTERTLLRTVAGWVGDVVGFGPSNQDALVKRIIGGPGSTVRCCSAEGLVQVDGVPLVEDYVVDDLPFIPGVNDCSTTPASPRCFAAISVPPDAYLVMGDNRANSADSVVACRGLTAPKESCARFVGREDVLGKVVAVMWPLNRVGVFSDDGR
ncbi:signal peptidase I [Microbacterium sp.]|jgi:signal peptidase I|uniref:signal peptidase I n=1 Tax=Microbacterium sp. TaxID=51671 RepID=UPI0037CA9817